MLTSGSLLVSTACLVCSAVLSQGELCREERKQQSKTWLHQTFHYFWELLVLQLGAWSSRKKGLDEFGIKKS